MQVLHTKLISLGGQVVPIRRSNVKTNSRTLIVTINGWGAPDRNYRDIILPLLENNLVGCWHVAAPIDMVEPTTEQIVLRSIPDQMKVAIETTRQAYELVKPKQVVLIGISMGNAVLSMILPELGGLPIKVISLVSPPDNFGETLLRERGSTAYYFDQAGQRQSGISELHHTYFPRSSGPDTIASPEWVQDVRNDLMPLTAYKLYRKVTRNQMLIIHTAQDLLIPASVHLEYKAGIPNARHVLLAGDHNFQVNGELHPQLGNVIADFLQL